MATISSPGIGSGLDVQSIVSQLVALERAPIRQLQTQASTLQTRLSTYGTIKSQMSDLADAATRLSNSSTWGQVSAASSNSTAIGATASAGALPGSYTMEVQQLARAQSTVSGAVTSGSGLGTGSITLELGSWSGGAFTPSGSPSVSIDIAAGEDSLGAIAARINAAGAGVNASVLRDASGERLMIQSRETGELAGFRISVTDSDGNNTDDAGLSRLAFGGGAGAGMTLTQSGLNAQATINGVTISSASNRLSDTLPGLNLQLSQVTTQPVEISVSTDLEGIRKDIDSFVEAYNKVNATLSSALKYDEATKRGGALQGDSTAVGLQNALRGMMRSITDSAPFSRLVDIGIELKSGGDLAVDASKLNAAFGQLNGVRDLFTIATGNPGTEGFARKIRSFAQGLLDSDGTLKNRSDALQAAITRNSREQERVEDRVSRSEARLLAQYTSLDSRLASLNGLSAFVSQQITLWNQSGKN